MALHQLTASLTHLAFCIYHPISSLSVPKIGFCSNICDCFSSFQFGIMGKAKEGDRAPSLWRPMSNLSFYPNRVVEKEAVLKLSFQFLKQHHENTEEKRHFLKRMKQRKLQLLKLVKFLRKKVKSFSKNPSQTVQLDLKEQSPDDEILSSPIPPKEKVPSASENQEAKASIHAETPQLVDLNQDYVDRKTCVASDETIRTGMPSAECDHNEAKTGASKVWWRDPVVSDVHTISD